MIFPNSVSLEGSNRVQRCPLTRISTRGSFGGIPQARRASGICLYHVFLRVQVTQGVSNMVASSWNHVFLRAQANQGSI